MRFFKPTLLALTCIPFFGQVYAQSDLDRQLADWDAIPVRQDLEVYCSRSLKYAESIIALKNKDQNILPALRWAEAEAEREAPMVPSEPMMAIGTMRILLNLIQRSYADQPIYSKISGGFPQWVHKSCLKGKSLN